MTRVTSSNMFTFDENEITIIDLCNEAAGDKTASCPSMVDNVGEVSIQEFPVSATCSIQSAALETLAFIRSFDKSGIFLQTESGTNNTNVPRFKMMAVIQQKCDAHKYGNFEQIANDVVLLLREFKKSTDKKAMELGKVIRRAWSSKDNDFLLRLENSSSHISTSETLSNNSSDVPARAAREFHRRTIFSLVLERKALCRHSVETRKSLTTFLELMLDLDASVSRHELLCHVLSYGWDYMARASNEGSLFVQPVNDPVFSNHTKLMKSEFYHIETHCIGEFIAAWQVFCQKAALKWPLLCSNKSLYFNNPNPNSECSFRAALQQQFSGIDRQLNVHVVLKKYCSTVYPRMMLLLDTMKMIPTSEDRNYIARRLLDIGWEFASLADADSLCVQSLRDHNPPKYEKEVIDDLLQKKEQIILYRTHFTSLADFDEKLFRVAENYFEWTQCTDNTEISLQHLVRLVYLWSVYCKAVKAVWPELIAFVAPQLLHVSPPEIPEMILPRPEMVNSNSAHTSAIAPVIATTEELEEDTEVHNCGAGDGRMADGIDVDYSLVVITSAATTAAAAVSPVTNKLHGDDSSKSNLIPDGCISSSRAMENENSLCADDKGRVPRIHTLGSPTAPEKAREHGRKRINSLLIGDISMEGAHIIKRRIDMLKCIALDVERKEADKTNAAMSKDSINITLQSEIKVMSNMEQMQIVPKQKEANGQTQFWRRVVSVSINTGKISKLEGVQILECWQAADLKHESDQKSITFASLLCGKFGTSKGSALYSTMKEVRSEVLQQIMHRRSTVAHWEPSTVATIMMNNFLEELDNVDTHTSKADTLHQDVRFMLDNHAALSPAPEDTKITTGLWAVWKTFRDAAHDQLDMPDAENHENVAQVTDPFADIHVPSEFHVPRV
eukprot:gene16659-18999_t